MRPSSVKALTKYLYSIDWTHYTRSMEYDENINNIHQTMMEALDTYIPETTHSINYKKLRKEPWVTAGIQASTKKAKLLYR